MPRYRVRLEDPDSDEFRVLFFDAANAGEAQAIAERKEAELVDFRLSDEVAEGSDEASDLAQAEERSDERGRPVFALVAHNQSKPYEVVSVMTRKQWLDGKWREDGGK